MLKDKNLFFKYVKGLFNIIRNIQANISKNSEINNVISAIFIRIESGEFAFKSIIITSRTAKKTDI